jgi:hypothetical protein
MTDNFTIIIEDIEPNIITIESSFIDNVGLVEIERFDRPSVNIISGLDNITVSDLPDIPVNKIIGLDEYLDQYQFDCGSP